MRVPKIFLVIVATMMFAVGTVHAEPTAIDWSRKVITVYGEGVASPNAISYAQAEDLAARAAKVDAYRKFAEIINGVHFESNRTIGSLRSTQQIKIRVEATIKGAKVIAQEYMPNYVYRVTMQLPLFGAPNSLASAVFPRQTVLEPFPDPEPLYYFEPTNSLEPVPENYSESQMFESTIVQGVSGEPVRRSVKDYASQAKGDYTGLIVNCKGLGLQPVMNPVIFNTNGTKIYGHKNLDPDKIILDGMVDYVTDPAEVSRAGNNPLVVNAVRLTDFNSNPVLSLADSNRILIENYATKFLKDLKVVFLYD